MDKNSNNKNTALNEAEHTERIRGLFASISGGYDFLNRFNSFRQDVAWRRRTAREMRFFKSNRLIDVATGTADIILEALREHPKISARGVDLVPELKEIGRAKEEKAGYSGSVELMEGNALELSFKDESFDVATIAFGIRNIRERLHALREMRRVIVPGGQVMVLELVFACPGVLRLFHGLYLNHIMPKVARMFSSNPEAYVYLAHSIMEFPTPQEFMGQMREAGLADVRFIPLTFGVAGLFIGKRPE
jgi:demethylmenaquinone methyltransferase/2-methoxy-6-polyprenyl-1,4-benzoquinol methylase